MKALCRFLLLVFLSGFSVHGLGQLNLEKQAFKVYDKKGNSTSYEALYQQALKADIVLFGELHNNSIIHWLQLELASDLAMDSSKRLILGAEMFERHQQLLVFEYVAGLISYEELNQETKLWQNTKTDYLPLLDVAKENNLKFIATNVPRVLAKQVVRMGLDSFQTTINDSLQYLLPPMPLEIDYMAPGYDELMAMDFGSNHGMSTELMVQAQALKDATMANSILNYLEKDYRFLHFQGDFHSKDYGGIYWYLNEYDKKKKVMTISCVESDDLKFNSEWKKRADFILVIPSNMTKTY